MLSRAVSRVSPRTAGNERHEGFWRLGGVGGWGVELQSHVQREGCAPRRNPTRPNPPSRHLSRSLTGVVVRSLSASSAACGERKTTQLKKMLNSNQTEFIMEAHNGLSAIIAQEAGFKGIWGSGLSISAAMGVRDSNEASWTQV